MLDAKGFKRPQYADLVASMETEARSRYGQDVNTRPLSPLGMLIRIFAFFLGLLWQDAEAIYNGDSLDDSEGLQLDRLGPRVGITRLQADYSTGRVTLTGTAGHNEPAGFLVATESGVQFETTSDAMLNNGTAEVPVRAIYPGTEGNVDAGTITVIVNPNPNITGVTNADITGGGREKETDLEFRARFKQSVAGGGAASVPALTGALLRVEGVRAATVIENYTNTPDADGRPEHSFEAYVLGGDRAAIADTIFRTKSAGIEPYGTETETVTDLSGNNHIMRFTYATEVPIYARITITTSPTFPTNGADLIRSAIIRYVGGTEADGSLWNGLSMGDDVTYARIVAAVMGVEGVLDATVELSTDGVAYSATNVPVGPQQVAQATPDRIGVTINA